MTEQELLDLGFEKVEILNKDSDNGFDYHYYNLDVTEGLSLVSNDSDTVHDNNWKVYNWDWPEIVIERKQDVIQLLQNFERLHRHHA